MGATLSCIPLNFLTGSVGVRRPFTEFLMMSDSDVNFNPYIINIVMQTMTVLRHVKQVAPLSQRGRAMLRVLSVVSFNNTKRRTECFMLQVYHCVLLN